MPTTTQVQVDVAKNKDFVPRGKKGSSPCYTSLFLFVRTIDNVIQYGCLALGLFSPLITFFGGTVIEMDMPYHGLGLSPYRLSLLTMVIATAIKHYWYVFTISDEAWHWQGAMTVGLFNIFWNTCNSLAFLNVSTSSAAGGETVNARIMIGQAAFWIGIFAETYSEMQRKTFKQTPAYKGKCYMGGLFSVTRHINYSGYTLWRAGLALSHGGWIWSMIVAAFFIYDFSTRAIPALDNYCTKRYGASGKNTSAGPPAS